MKKAIFITFVILQGCWLNAQDLPDDLQIGRHTVAEWKYIVDTTWGDGMPTEDKLILFDRFWEAADQHYAGFVNNPVDWDSVKNHYRPEIENGVSKGRFAGIIAKMGLLLQEGHGGAINSEVYLTKPGPDVPILIAGFYSNWDSISPLDNGWFGATLTPLNEDELLVLRSVENHPMGLEAGDIVLGYDGKPWKELYPLLLGMDFPYTTNDRGLVGNIFFHGDRTGSSNESVKHKWLAAAGMNWHFFDTLDFRKYNSADTLHLPTSLLEGKQMSIAGNEQLPVEAIEFPGSLLYEAYPAQGGVPPVIFDTILDQSIGYVYYLYMNSSDKLKNAINSLAQSEVQGIILDLRYNLGGDAGWETGFNSIFNRTIDSCGYFERMINGGHSDLVMFSPAFPYISEEFINKPVALITGPGAISMGDYASYFIHTQPMTRSFGRGTNTGFTYVNGYLNTLEKVDHLNYNWDFGYPEWEVQFVGMNFGRFVDGELNYFIHKGFEIDEEIWFTQEAAHQQEDNMVERAVQWIKSVAYVSNPSVQNSNMEPGTANGPFILKTGHVNPESHPVELDVKVYSRDGSLIEKVNMEENNNGSLPDIKAGEWYGNFTPEQESFYYAEFSTHDLLEDSWLTYPGKVIFTSVSTPEIFPKVLYVPENKTTRFDISITNTAGVPLTDIQLNFSCDNPYVDIKMPVLNYTHLLDIDMADQKMQVVIIDEAAEDSSEIWMNVDISSGGERYWNDSILLVNTVVGVQDFIPLQELKIYPNPMHEFCRIEVSGQVPLDRVEVYDLSGRMVYSESGIGTNSSILEKGGLVNGIYILKVYADRIYERKLVIQ